MSSGALKHAIRGIVFRLVLLGAAAVPVSSATAETPPALADLLLPRNIELAVPADWTYTDSQIRSAITSAAGTKIDLRSLQPQTPPENILDAQAPPDRGYATVSLQFFSEPSDPGQIRDALNGADSFKALADYQESVIRDGLPASRRYIERISVQPVTLDGGFPGYTFVFRREGDGGSVRVEFLTVFRPDGYAILELEYRESEAARWVPLMESIRHSLSVRPGT